MVSVNAPEILIPDKGTKKTRTSRRQQGQEPQEGEVLLPDKETPTTDYSKIIKAAYYDVKSGFGGVRKLYAKLKPLHPDIRLVDISNTLKKQFIYVRTKKAGVKNSFIPRFPKQEFQIDLIVFEDVDLNGGIEYGLTCVDVFTKIGHMEFIKERTSIETAKAMKKILSDEVMGVPKMIYSDEGGEFKGEFKKLLDKHKIEQIFTIGHATFIERFNRTIKEMIQKYLSSTHTKTFVLAMPELIKNYNNSYHSIIRMAPNEVKGEYKIALAQINIYNHANFRKRVNIEVGDKVRVRKKIAGFDKMYKPIWHTSVHTVISKKKEDGGNTMWYRVSNPPTDDPLAFDPAALEGLTEKQKLLKRKAAEAKKKTRGKSTEVRRYLRNEIELEGDLEENENEPLWKGTKEQKLRDKGKHVPSHTSAKTQAMALKKLAPHNKAGTKEPQKNRMLKNIESHNVGVNDLPKNRKRK